MLRRRQEELLALNGDKVCVEPAGVYEMIGPTGFRPLQAGDAFETRHITMAGRR
jgi:hypothetical protein